MAIFVAHHYPTIAWHEHDFYELAVVASGRASTRASTASIPVEVGTVIFIPPGVSHEYAAARISSSTTACSGPTWTKPN